MNSNQPKNQPTNKFLADAMLGRLAKWLRILGYDTAFLADTDDFAVMRLARAEGRIILTRDRELSTRRGVEALFINSETLKEQLRQVWQQIGPPPDTASPRCPVCNTRLSPADAQTVAAHVPRYVQQTQKLFSFCTDCERVYWPGTHWEQMRDMINDTLELQNPLDSATMSLLDNGF